MPQFRLQGDQFVLLPDPTYFVDLASDFDGFCETKSFTDVTIQCNDGQLSAHKTMLVAKSRLLSAFFQDNSSSSHIICPDFSVDTMAEFLKLIYTGQAIVSEGPDFHLTKDIIKSLDVHIKLSASPLKHLNLGEGEDPEIEDEVDTVEASIGEVNILSDESLSDVEILEDSTSTKPTKMRKKNSKGPTFECQECGKAFGMQIALNKHRQRYHQPNATATSDEPSDIRSQGTSTIEEHNSQTCRKPEKAPQSK